MPTAVTTATRPVVLTPVGGSVGTAVGAISTTAAATLRALPVQICGFVPLTNCSTTECRSFNGSCYINPVYGTIGVSTSAYENDLNSFFINDTLRRRYKIYLQKVDSAGNWVQVADLLSTVTYGISHIFGSFPTHPTYMGFTINWGYVLTHQGSGIYRLNFTSNVAGNLPYCDYSEPFRLMPFNCNAANHTVKFEANQSGMVGSHNSDTSVFDLCGITLYDSIRINGLFREVSPTKIDEYLEYQTGAMDLVNAKLVLKYLWESQMIPEYIYKRLMVYGGLSGSMFASDYNLSNSRYDIKLIPIIMKSLEIEPNKANRQTPVKIQCESGIQSIIKSTSCNLVH